MDVYTECLKMKLGDELLIELDHEPKRGELSELCARVNRDRHSPGVVVSFRRNGRMLYTSCHKQSTTGQ